MTSTVLVTLPVTTVTIDTTYQRTSFLTIKVTVLPLQIYGTTTKPFIATSITDTPTFQTATSDALQASRAIDSLVSLPSVVVGNGQQTSLVASTTLNNTAPTDALGGAAATAASTNAPPVQQKQMQQHEKHVIIGSLCGAIAAFLAIGLLICIVLRCRHKRHHYHDHSLANTSMTEKGMMNTTSASTEPTFMTRWRNKLLRHAQSGRDLAVAAVTAAKPTKARNQHRHQVSGTGSPLKCGRRHHAPPGTAPTREQSNTSSVTVDEDHHIIRMSTHHWPRPYARGQSYRDSLPPGVLRVMNPDRSLPPTPRDSCSGDDLVAVAAAAGGAVGDAGGHGGRASSFKNFLRRPKPALIAAAAAAGQHHRHNGASRSRSSSRSLDALASAYTHGHGHGHNQHQQQAQGAPIPSITIDASLSQECIPSQVKIDQINSQSRHPSPVPSFSSYPSLASMHTVRQRPPEDPFFQPSSTPASEPQQRPPGTSHTLPLPPRSDRSVWSTTPAAAAASGTPSDRRGSFTSTLDSSRSRFGGGTSRLLQALRTRAWSNSRFDGRAAAGAPSPRAVDPTPPSASRRSTGTGLSMWSYTSGDAGAAAAMTMTTSDVGADGQSKELAQQQQDETQREQQQQQRQQHLLAAQQLWARRSDPFDLDRASLRSDPAAESSSDGATTIETLPLAAEKEIESGGPDNWTTRITPQHVAATTPRSLYEGT